MPHEPLAALSERSRPWHVRSGELNVYEDTNLDQSPLAWLEQELFAPAIPAFKGYQSRAGFIGLSATGGSVLCPNKTCAETGARLCDGLGVRNLDRNLGKVDRVLGKFCDTLAYLTDIFGRASVQASPSSSRRIANRSAPSSGTAGTSRSRPLSVTRLRARRLAVRAGISVSVQALLCLLLTDGKALHGTDRKLVLHE